MEWRPLQGRCARPVCRPPKKPVVCYHGFVYRAGSWDRERRVVAKVEWHQGEWFARDPGGHPALWCAAAAPFMRMHGHECTTPDDSRGAERRAAQNQAGLPVPETDGDRLRRSTIRQRSRRTGCGLGDAALVAGGSSGRITVEGIGKWQIRSQTNALLVPHSNLP